MKRILITGANSYIGESFKAWAEKRYPDEFEINTIDMIDGSWRETDFSGYDVVFHVAGIVHKKEKPDMKSLYKTVNTKLPIEVAQKAQIEGVGQFIFMSSMSVYGMNTGVITRETKAFPRSLYGKSKLLAEKELLKMNNDGFRIAVLRPPMVYGQGCKGNYLLLTKAARVLPLFPNIENRRSMLYIDNLCEFLCLLIESGRDGIYFPQNREYVKTSDMVKIIAIISGHKIWLTKLLNPFIWIVGKIPGRISVLLEKVFGSLVYELELSQYEGFNYQLLGLRESVKAMERW